MSTGMCVYFSLKNVRASVHIFEIFISNIVAINIVYKFIAL